MHGTSPAVSTPRAVIADIIAAAAMITRIPVASILGKGRGFSVIEARFAVYSIAREQGYTVAQIGRRMNRHPTTVSAGCRRIAQYAQDDPVYAWLIQEIRRKAEKQAARGLKP